MFKWLERFEVLLDVAEVHSVSLKMKQTGKVSSKVLCKWRKRETKNTRSDLMCSALNKPHLWMMVRARSRFSHRRVYYAGQGLYILWACRRCSCQTQKIRADEVSDQLKTAYPDNIIWDVNN